MYVHVLYNRFQNRIGCGQFGEVHTASWTIEHHKLLLAVKTLKSGATEEDKVKFLQEAAIMGQFHHPNVIKMYGVITLQDPVSHITIYCLSECYECIYITFIKKFKVQGLLISAVKTS